MGFSILQWNSRSIFKKWHEFKHYLSALDDLPDVLCIQESHLTLKYQPSIPHYQVIRKDRPLSKGKGGGLMVCVKTSLDFPNIDVALHASSKLEVLGIAVDGFSTIPSNPLTSTSLDFLSNFAKVILCGVFNAHHLVLVSSSYASLCTCTVTSEFLGSDHSIVLTNVNANTTPEDHGVPKWNFSKADWQKFSAACDQNLPSFYISLSYAYCLFETSVREAALEAIPQSKKSLEIVVPWWNKQCDVAVKNKKHALNRMKRTWLLSDMIIFKRCRSRARRIILEAKSSSWRQFCTSLTSNTNLSKVWKVIKSFSGHRSSYFIPTLHAQGISAKNEQHKSNMLANQFALRRICQRLRAYWWKEFVCVESLLPCDVSRRPLFSFLFSAFLWRQLFSFLGENIPLFSTNLLQI